MTEEDELTYGETIKKPLPELEDVEWIMVEAPEWIESELIMITHKDKNYSIYQGKKEDNILSKPWVEAVGMLHENSKDFKVTWKLKQTDPHADIKAEYEKAIAEGKIVKLKVWFCGRWETVDPNHIDAVLKGKKPENVKIFHYNIDWNKLLSWSYANGEFVECEFSDDCHFHHIERGRLSEYCKGISHQYGVYGGMRYKYFRLAKCVEIKDEWLKEVK